MPRPRERMEAHMSSWIKGLHESRKTERRERHPPFVTISRESGAYGMTIADLLAEHLRKHERRRAGFWAVFDKELIQKVMEEHQFPARFESYFAESCTSLIKDVIEEVLGLHPAQEILVRRVNNTILHLAMLGHVILVGRGANIITRRLPNGTHVRLVGSFEKRVAHMKEYLDLPEKEAREYVTREDHNRHHYIKRYFQRDINDMSLYDLVINTDTVSPEDAITIIGDMVLRTDMRQAA